MFSLIIVIISIALVAALAAAAIFYGGSSMQKGSSQATETRLLNESQQVKNAFLLHATEIGQPASGLSELVDKKYLSSVPAGWESSQGYTYKTHNDESACLAINRKAGIDAIPSCADPAYATVPVCCTMPADAPAT